MKYLLDTVTVSELRKSRPDPNVIDWINHHRGDRFCLSAVTVGEIYRGIISVRKKDPAFAGRLSTWLEGIIRFYGKDILPVTTEVALEWALISAKTGNSSSDNMIAATAKCNGLTVVTRNTSHFQVTGVDCVDPWIKE